MMGAHVILLCNIALVCFIDSSLKACASPSSEVHQRELSLHGGSTRCVSRNGGSSTLGGWRLGESSLFGHARDLKHRKGKESGVILGIH